MFALADSMSILKSPIHLSRIEAWDSPGGRLYLKREDLNESGSHKERAAEAQFRHYAGRRPAVLLSSSGNAAIASARMGLRHSLPVYCFMSKRTPASKVEKCLSHKGRVILSDKAVNLAKYAARLFKIPNLRPSRCALSVTGFQSLGQEILEGLEFLTETFDSVFQFSSSGSSLVAVGQVLAAKRAPLSLHAVQAGPVCPIAAPDDVPARLGSAPRTGALCAKKTDRAGEARDLLAATGGRGWVVRDDEVDRAQQALWDSHRLVSRESAASLAAAWRAMGDGVVDCPLVVLTGRAVTDKEPLVVSDSRVQVLDDYLETKAYFEEEAKTWTKPL